MKAVFWLGIMVLMQISRLHFNASRSRIVKLIPHIYVCNFSGDFQVYLEINRFSEIKVYGERKFCSFGVVLKL